MRYFGRFSNVPVLTDHNSQISVQMYGHTIGVISLSGCHDELIQSKTHFKCQLWEYNVILRTL